MITVADWKLENITGDNTKEIKENITCN